MGISTRQYQSEIWWLFLLEGIAALILGVLLITSPVITAEVLVTFLGAYWLMSGLLSIIRIFVLKGGAHWIWSLLFGIVGILAGLFVLQHPLISTLLVTTTLVIVLGIQALIMGALGLVRGFQGEGWGSIVLGVLNILIGIVLLVTPLSAALAVPLVLGVFAIIGGVAVIAASFSARGMVGEGA